MVRKTIHSIRWTIETILTPLLFCSSIILYVLGDYKDFLTVGGVLIVLLILPLTLSWKSRLENRNWVVVYEKLHKDLQEKGFKATRKLMLETNALAFDDKDKSIAVIEAKEIHTYPFNSLVKVESNFMDAEGLELVTENTQKEVIIHLQFSEGNVTTSHELVFYRKNFTDSEDVHRRLNEALSWYHDLKAIKEQSN